MLKKFIDISVPIETGIKSDPPSYALEIDYIDHQDTVATLAQRYDGLDTSKLPQQEGFAIEKLKLTTHNGTHVDAPWHYASVMSDGSRAPTIDELPLSWFFGNGVKLDMRHMENGSIATEHDVKAALDAACHTLSEGDIVLINTPAGSRYGQEDYPDCGFGMGREATHYLISHGIRVAGTDAWSWDVPHKYAIARFREDHDVSRILEGHKAGTEKAFCHMEKLHNLEQLPPSGFTVACFPVKVRGASGGWTRAVAIFDE